MLVVGLHDTKEKICQPMMSMFLCTKLKHERSHAFSFRLNLFLTVLCFDAAVMIFSRSFPLSITCRETDTVAALTP